MLLAQSMAVWHCRVGCPIGHPLQPGLGGKPISVGTALPSLALILQALLLPLLRALLLSPLRSLMVMSAAARVRAGGTFLV